MKANNKKGFTLIELLAVVLIIGILASISVPLYQKVILKARSAEVNNLLTMVRTRQGQHYAKNKVYATKFEDNPILAQITTDGSSEVNQGNKKIVNRDYELELFEDELGHRCVIGRYKPNRNNEESGGEPNFAFAISYEMNGLGCSDKDTPSVEGDSAAYTKKICSSFGNIVGTVEDVCQGLDFTMQDVNIRPCCAGYQMWSVEDQRCIQIPGVAIPDNYNIVENPNDVNACLQCKYCTGDNCGGENQDGPTPITHNGGTGWQNAEPAIADVEFLCKKAESAGGTQPNDDGLYTCHSAYYKVWSDEQCAWICPSTVNFEDLCPNGRRFNRNSCTCECALGERCGCHETQVSTGNGNECRCIASADQVFNPSAPLGGDSTIGDGQVACICSGRAEYGEVNSERELREPYTQCSCRDGKKPVFFGTITDRNGNTHPTTSETQNAAGDENLAYKAACCDDSANQSHFWPHPNGFEYDACCPYTDYTAEGVSQAPVHIEFNIATRQCCGENKPFFNLTAQNNLTDDNSNYSNRPINLQIDNTTILPIPANICHQCESFTQAYDQTRGCYQCQGITFTIWNGSVSTCVCPTGTIGTPNTPWDAESTVTDCQCRKKNTYWNSGISWDANPTTRSAWHIHNGACKCIENDYVDTYWGFQLDAEGNGTQTVPNDDGYCCPAAYQADVYDDNGIVSGEVACCPDNTITGKKFFHNTTYANNTCGICQNQTDTVIDKQCRPCPEGMVPVYNESLGYSLCACPQGTHYADGIHNQPFAAETNICKCDLAYAEWQPNNAGDWVNNYIQGQINGNINASMGGNWDNVNGYCVCSGDYQLATYGEVSSFVPSDNIPASGALSADNASSGGTGYCCPTTPQNQWYQVVGFTPVHNFCCNADVAFNSQDNYCCQTPYFYSTADVIAAGLGTDRTGNPYWNPNISFSVTSGACANCNNPALDQNCDQCPFPKVPVWNNGEGGLGFSTCVCPKGMETQSQHQSWWDNFLERLRTLFGLEEVVEGVNGCYCPYAGTTWSDTPDENGYYCRCSDGLQLMASNTDSSVMACCPIKPQKTVLSGSGDDYSCCPVGKEYYYDGECHLCPSDRPHYYDMDGNESFNSAATSLTAEEVAKYCHACPKDKPYYLGRQCCPNDISGYSAGQTVYLIEVPGFGQRCTTCHNCQPGGGGLNCTTGVNGIAPIIEWNDQVSSYVCTCPNGVTYDPVYGCPCTSQCANHTTTTGNQYSNYLQSSCSCNTQYREFNNACCTDSSQPCCKCKRGYTEVESAEDYHSRTADYGDGCCLNSDVVDADNGKKACCGTINAVLDARQAHVAFNLTQDKCCTAEAPYYIASKGSCSRCPQENQIWNGQDCVTCDDPLQEPGGWNSELGVFTQCVCKSGFSETGLGGEIKDSVCKCISSGEYYLDSYYVQAVIPNGSCQACPGGKVFNVLKHKCDCPEGTSWYDTGYPTPRCARCPAEQYWDGTQCQDCSFPREVGEWLDSSYAFTLCNCQAGFGISGLSSQQQIGNSGCYCQTGFFWSSTANPFPMDTATNSAYVACLNNPNPDTCSCVTCSGNRILRNGQCECQQEGEHFLDDNYQACPVGQDSSCSCKRCPTERGFAYDSNTGSCVCAGGKIVTVSSNSLTIQNANGASYNIANNEVYCTNGCPTGTQECNGICKCIHNPYGYSISGDATISFSSSVSSVLTNQINILSRNIGNCNYVCPSNYCGNLVWTINNEGIYLCSKPSDGTCSNNIPVGEQTAVVFNNTCQGTTTSMSFVIRQ